MDHSHHQSEHHQSSKQRADKHVNVSEHQVHDKHAGHHTHDFLKRFWVCVALTVPVLALSHMIQNWLGFKISFPGDRYVLLVLSSAIYVYGGWPFLIGLIREMKHRVPGMMTLVAVA